LYILLWRKTTIIIPGPWIRQRIRSDSTWNPSELIGIWQNPIGSCRLWSESGWRNLMKFLGPDFVGWSDPIGPGIRFMGLGFVCFLDCEKRFLRTLCYIFLTKTKCKNTFCSYYQSVLLHFVLDFYCKPWYVGMYTVYFISLCYHVGKSERKSSHF